MADIIGTTGNDVLDGESENDLIRGLTGNDVINGGDGDDVIFGGGDSNTLTGGAGNDVFGIEERSTSSNGGDQIHDIQDFTIGEDRIDLSFLNIPDFETLQPFLSQDFDDLIIEFSSDSFAERFILRDVSFNDLSASDFIFNTDTTDLTVGITGRTFTDYTLFGAAGDDVITSDSGDDNLSGGGGDDEISAGFGDNVVRGGTGSDDFNITARDFFTTNTTIADFTNGEDQLDVSFLNISTFADLSPYLSQDDDDVVFRTVFDNASETYRFTDKDLADFTAADFIFNTSTADLDVTASGRSFTDYVLFGGAGDDDITSGSGDDELTGGAGDDDIAAGFGTNIVRGGAGNDDFNITGRDFSATNTIIEDFTIGEDQLDVRIFNVGDFTTLSPYLSQDGDDVVLRTFFDSASEVYRLNNVLLEDLSADDFIFNDINIDLTVNAQGRSFTDYVLFGGNGDDTINGSGAGSSGGFGSGENELNGGAGDDELNGGGDRDVLNGGDGADELNGFGGFDQASYISARTGVNVNLATGEASGDQTEGDTFSSIEGLVGSQFDDVLVGTDDEAGRFDGLDGDDVIVTGDSNGNINIVFAGDGNDTVTGGSGRDRIEGGAGNDIINSGEGFDEIDGGTGDDAINAGTDVNVVDGGEGVDTLVFDEGFAFVREELFGDFDNAFEIGEYSFSSGSSVFYNGTYANIEHIEVEGITFDVDVDSLQQFGDGNQLFLTNESEVVQAVNTDSVFGFAGNDYLISSGDEDHSLFGGAGSDYLVGNRGDDVLAGDASVGLSGAEGLIFQAYQAVFNRVPDIAGFNANVLALRLINNTLLNSDDLLEVPAVRDRYTELISTFVESAEFGILYGDLTDNADFIDQLFANVLPGNTDPVGRAAFTAELDGGRSRASVVTELATTPEFVQLQIIPSAAFATNVVFDPVEGQVFRIYQAMLNRAPDDIGFLNFTNSIQAGVLDVFDVIDEFIDSPEFISIFGQNVSNRDFVEALYTNVLPGNDDQVGRDAFTAALENGTSRAELVAEFADSIEFRAQTQQATLEFVRQVEDGASADILDGGNDDDFLIGGRGDDTFIYDISDGDGQDVIADFVAGDASGDVIRLFGTEDFDSFAEIFAVASQEGTDVFFNFGDGNTIRLNNVNLGDLNEGDFDIIPDESSDAGSAKSSPASYALDDVTDTNIFVEDFDAGLLG